MRRGCRSRYLSWAGLVLCALPFAAAAQTLNFANTDSKDPIEITAEQGIEWQRDKLVFLAKGNAHAIRGDVNVYADTLTAHYREKTQADAKTQTNSKGTEIWRLDADGNVRIVSPDQKAFGDKGVYDVDKAILVLTSAGKRVRFVTAQDVISSDKQLEYWETKQMAVARGNAVATREDRVLKADVLAAYFRKDEQGKSRVYRIEAFDNVRVNTAQERAIADRGVYVVATGIAVLTGRVRMFRGSDELNGCKAEINLNTGISKLFSCPPSAEGGGRVHGVLKSSKGNKALPSGKEK